MNHIKYQFESGQREFDDQHSKMMQPMDHDMLRVKILKEIEAPHKIAMENKQAEVEGGVE